MLPFKSHHQIRNFFDHDKLPGPISESEVKGHFSFFEVRTQNVKI